MDRHQLAADARGAALIAWASTPEEKQGAAAWLAARLPDVGAIPPDKAQFAIVVRDAAPAAVVAYSLWNPVARTIQMTIAAETPRWATRAAVSELLAYPFEKAGVFKIWLSVEESNERSLRFTRGIGFRKEAKLPHQFGPERAAIVLGMTLPWWQGSKWSVRNVV